VCELEEGEPGAAPRGREVRREEARRLRAPAHVLERRRDGREALVQEPRLEREDLLLDERADQAAQVFHLFGSEKVHESSVGARFLVIS
jgi:hypothetical protein